MIHFVSGIDTDAGKSVATGWLARRWQDAGRRVITQKLVQTGCTNHSEDIACHRAMMGKSFPEDAEGLTAPAIFSYPCSPHLAARIDGRTLDLEHITRATAELDRRYDDVLLEGAGGLMVPLTDNLLTLDYLQAQGYPLIFVTGGGLGSISHTLLAFEVIKARGINLEAVLYNRFPGRRDTTIDNETYAYLQRMVATDFPKATWDELPILEHL